MDRGEHIITLRCHGECSGVLLSSKYSVYEKSHLEVQFYPCYWNRINDSLLRKRWDVRCSSWFNELFQFSTSLLGQDQYPLIFLLNYQFKPF